MKLPVPPISCRVPTPVDLADALVRALGDKPQSQWLEPSHGDGVFLRAMSNAGISRERIVAIDLESTVGPLDFLARTTRPMDFLLWAATTDLRFDYIVGNPPYVSIKRLPQSLRQTASRVVDVDGNPIGNRANTWYAFVVSSIRLLNRGGSLGFVLPSAAEFADYALELRSALKDSFESLEIFRSRRSMFANVQEGTVVAIARGYGQGPLRYRRREFADKAALVAALLKQDKIRARPCPKDRREPVSGNSLGSLAKIRLGGVTGDANFFLMDESRRVKLGLPGSSLIPVVTKARQLKSIAIGEREWEALKLAGERIWLFNPTEGDMLHKSVRRYLELNSESGGCNKEAFKIASRNPWYHVPLPELPDAFISGMSNLGPWMSFNEMPGLNATNTLYVVTFNDRNPNNWYRWALAMLTSTSQRQIKRIGRRYADGLVKYEPGMLANLRLPNMGDRRNYRRIYETAISALLVGDHAKAKEIADSNLSQ